MRVLGIDPSNTRHAWAIIESGSDDFDDLRMIDHGRDFRVECPNSRVRDVDLVAIEMIASYGMAVGAHTFDTCVEIGILLQMLHGLQGDFDIRRITRVETKRIVCSSVSAKDANVRAAVIDCFGGPESIKKGGPLWKVAKDEWAAIAVALAAASGEAKWYTPVADKEMLE